MPCAFVTCCDGVTTPSPLDAKFTGTPAIGLPAQDQIATHGFAIQCRVTTENPADGFRPTKAEP